MRIWQTSNRSITFDRTLVMAILNVTPDSFSDGARHYGLEQALRRVDAIVAEGADIVDIGGESTRPGAESVAAEVEIERVVPVIAAVRERFDIPVSVDTSKSAVAEAACAAGAEIINDISGLRFDERIGEVAANRKAGLVLMHSRGDYDEMHRQEIVPDIIPEVVTDFRRSIAAARRLGVTDEQVVLDVGIGFGKSLNQNLELIAKIGKLAEEFPAFPLLVGASRKSFIGKITGVSAPAERLPGSLAAAAISAWNGAHLVRVHDVRETVECLKVVGAARTVA